MSSELWVETDDERVDRLATSADVVAWLQANGGEVRSLWSWNESGKRKVMEPGRYLVYRLPDEEQP